MYLYDMGIQIGKFRKCFPRDHEWVKMLCYQLRCNYKKGTKDAFGQRTKVNIRFICQECEFIANKGTLL